MIFINIYLGISFGIFLYVLLFDKSLKYESFLVRWLVGCAFMILWLPILITILILFLNPKGDNNDY